MTYNPNYLPNQSVADDFPLARPLDPVVTVDPAADDLTWALQTLKAHHKDFQLYDDYMHGKHRLTFATQEYQATFRLLLEGLACNICPAVVYAITDRLQIDGFGTHDDGTKADAQAAWDLWEHHNLAYHANKVHDEAVSMGDAFLLVWPDMDGQVRFYPHTALEMCHKHDEERPEIITLAAKLWKDGKRYRLNLYYPGQIEKYRTKQDSTEPPSKASAFEPYSVDGASTIGNPYGQVPVFHFAFDATIHAHGCSEIKDVIPIQDLLNKTIADMAVAGEFGAYPQRYLLGIEPDRDDEGRELPVPFKAGIDRLLTVANPDTKAGQFEAANLEAYTKVIDSFFSMVARVKGIPLSYFFMSGDAPSGEALKTAESRLNKRVEKTMRSFGESWSLVMEFALKVAAAAEAAQLSVTWAAPESRNELSEAQTIAVKVKDLKISLEQGWREAGYSDKQITDMKAEKAAQQPAAVVPSASMRGTNG